MSVRTQSQIDAIIVRAKQSSVNFMMVYGQNLNVGVAAVPPMLKMQLVLIECTESNFATLVQKNLYVDTLLKYNLAPITGSSLFASNLTETSL